MQLKLYNILLLLVKILKVIGIPRVVNKCTNYLRILLISHNLYYKKCNNSNINNKITMLKALVLI